MNIFFSLIHPATGVDLHVRKQATHSCSIRVGAQLFGVQALDMRLARIPVLDAATVCLAETECLQLLAQLGAKLNIINGNPRKPTAAQFAVLVERILRSQTIDTTQEMEMNGLILMVARCCKYSGRR